MDTTRMRRTTPALAGWLGLFVVLNIGDLVSTYVALGLNMREGNPLMSTLLQQYGFKALVAYKLAVVLTVGLGVLLLRRYHPRLAQITLYVCNALVFTAVLLNLVQLNIV